MAKTDSSINGKQGYRKHPSLDDRLAQYTDKTGGPRACWLWIGAKDDWGYGIICVTRAAHARKVLKAHRVIYERAFGPIGAGLRVLHSCDVPACVNPAHLSVGTDRDNKLDSVAKGRHAHGTRLPNATINDTIAAEIRRLYADGRKQYNRIHTRGTFTMREIAKLLGITPSVVNAVARRKGWKHVH